MAARARHRARRGRAPSRIRRAMETQLFGVQPMDPAVLALGRRHCSALVAFVACAVPARRAARIDPLIALTDQ